MENFVANLISSVKFPNADSTIALYFLAIVIRILACGPIPRHVAFILDGNRRLAAREGIEIKQGHALGYEKSIAALKICCALGVKFLSIYVFSIENFQRSKKEVEDLTDLIAEKLNTIAEDSFIKKYDVQIRVIGVLSLFPENVRTAARRAMTATRQNSGVVLNICAAYTSTQEILHAIQQLRDCDASNDKDQYNKLAAILSEEKTRIKVSQQPCERDDVLCASKTFFRQLVQKSGESSYEIESRQDVLSESKKSFLTSKKGNACGAEGLINSLRKHVTEEQIGKRLYTAGCPRPDILIRTSGETRLSNFMLWQCCESTYLSFCGAMLPEFTAWRLFWVIVEYQKLYPSLKKHRELLSQITRARKKD